MRRTYKSKKETAGAIDPREVLLTLDAKSSIFDAFYIQNIKKTKKDMSIGSTMQFAASNKVRKRKYVKRLKEQAFQPRESTSNTVFLTPNKSFRVNKAPDLFDQLLNSSCNKVETTEPVSFKKTPAIPQKTYIKKRPIKKKSYYSNSESSDSDKENFNSSEESNRTADTSDIRSHKLIIEKELRTSPKTIDKSLYNIVNNLSIFTDRKKQMVLNPNIRNNNLTKLAPLQNSPLCSTPFLKKYRGASIYRFSPISINLDDSPKHVTVMEDVNDYSRDNSQVTHKAKNKVNNYEIDTNQIIKDATIIENIEQSIVPENEEYNDMNNETATASIVYDSVYKMSNQNEIQSPILPNRTTNNKREPTKHSPYLSYMQTTELEPFHGFEDIDLIKNDKLEAINHKYMEMEKVLVDKSNATTPKRLSQKSKFVNTNIKIIKDTSNSNTSSSVESSDSESFYDTCYSDSDNKEQVEKIEPLVVVERLNSSTFEQYYSQMANYSINSNDSKTSSNSSDYTSVRLSVNVSNISSNNSVISENYTKDNNSNISICNDENNESIASNEIDDNDYSIESKPEDVFVSFVTTRRRNEFHNDSLLDFDNSIVSASSHEYDKTILTNKNSVENANVTLEENIVNSIDETSNVDEEEIDQDIDTECKYISESNEISKTVLSPKVKKIFTRKSVRESFKGRKNKSLIHKRPAIKDNADDSLNIEIGEKDQSKTEFKSSNSHSDDLIRTKLSPKVKNILTRKSARESIEALKSNSPCNIRYSKSRETADERDYSSNISTRKSSRVYRDSIARESQTFTGYEDNMGNDSISSELPGIILQPGKRWERSLSIYRRMTTMVDHCDNSILDEEQSKSRKYRQSVISPLELQDLKGSFHNDSINSRRSTFVSKPSRSTIKIVRESNTSRASLCSTIVCEDLEGFLGEDCDDTIVELSKLSIADSEHEVTIIEKFHDTSNRRTTARDYVLRRCNQADVLPFDECYPDTVLKNCRKIGEGVYGEVFLWRAGDGRARVLKVIPIAGDIKVNGEQQKDFHEIISEIVIAMELSALRAPIADIEQHLNEGKTLETLDLHSVENATDAFNEVLRVRCVCGRYPSRLLELWELYDECRGSENDSPATLPPQQQYVVLELANAGEDLESYHFINAEQAYALFKQIAFGLAVAEEAYQFEHRDLHWGNVLISPTEEKYASFVVRGAVHLVRRCGVRASLIDYSLSRATLGRCALYNDLAHDDALFDALGDYQFQLYRLMRDKLGNDWKTFEPYTNILWLHYTVDKMITALRYTRTNTKIHKHYIAKLKEIKNRILDYGSAVQYVLTDNEL